MHKTFFPVPLFVLSEEYHPHRLHIENSIYHDVFSEDFEDWLSQLNKEKIYLLYCNVGHRSGIALNKMKEMGFKNLYHLYEGIREWIKQGFKTAKN
ncbi:MAG TPA: rhodanese-like domain-containing protein [Bacteroidales bacterium]|nr:rhodanese-like domain-containing protein [Bacteroidales bacterium]